MAVPRSRHVSSPAAKTATISRPPSSANLRVGSTGVASPATGASWEAALRFANTLAAPKGDAPLIGNGASLVGLVGVPDGSWPALEGLVALGSGAGRAALRFRGPTSSLALASTVRRKGGATRTGCTRGRPPLVAGRAPTATGPISGRGA